MIRISCSDDMASDQERADNFFVVVGTAIRKRC